VKDAGRPGLYGPGVPGPIQARGQDERREMRVGLAQLCDQVSALTVG
jgi:hypothetical protein